MLIQPTNKDNPLHRMLVVGGHHNLWASFTTEKYVQPSIGGLPDGETKPSNEIIRSLEKIMRIEKIFLLIMPAGLIRQPIKFGDVILINWLKNNAYFFDDFLFPKDLS